ncbi:hypothetical protein XENTR_v10019942 [Xenopus tropicalis]|uniref:B box and SPRY domain-containing protein n=1 Tax=Xenopus tropicalis TaxID=8364 RepID=A0A803JLS3_XENTR|nr:B box and SPRY domain-containing protein [Xenopus tropicalis]KAE8582092.1 hypothetical protein XENTR_v10019942 [Xenopus tropicalis]KAE8582093.1 hypothetical protein XENTR_v10019942 [Xenopus tropicalis]KAE8582094.1 hypothetical protein XENTR_v10019942 [Xenopus tropicalis]
MSEEQGPLWAISGPQIWAGSGRVGHEEPWVGEWPPGGQEISLGAPGEEPGDLGMIPAAGTSDPQPGGTCREHGGPLLWFCYPESRLICQQCRNRCQNHRTVPLEERAAQIRNKIVDRCEKLQLQTAGIQKYLGDTLPAKTPRVAATARAARELVIQRLNLIRTVCDNEEQRLLEEVHAEEERAQQGILTQRAHWSDSALKLSGIRTDLVDMLTKLDDLNLISSAEAIEERTEEAEGILEPQESDKLNFNPNCVQSPMLKRLWVSSVFCCPAVCEDITFDTKTMGPLLALTEDKALTFLQKKAKNYSDEPERFNHWPNCFATGSFQGGVHSWKVNVEKSGAYKLGVAYGSMARKGSGNDSRLGYNPDSWVFSRYDKDFRFSHNSEHQAVELLRSPKHIGVVLDYDVGELIFYDPGACVVLHTHRARFHQPVFPVFAVADESIAFVQ